MRSCISAEVQELFLLMGEAASIQGAAFWPRIRFLLSALPVKCHSMHGGQQEAQVRDTKHDVRQKKPAAPM
jgi:hypothetical protein